MPALVSGVLISPGDPIRINFGTPVITSTIHFEINPTFNFTLTWDAPTTLQSNEPVTGASSATITHTPFQTGVVYTLHLLPGGQAVSGLPVAEASYSIAYWRYRYYMPVTAKN